ncbi:hypothetical protein MRS44_017798 [Fusarium solani]|uniref:uncharacterized protein n=1 Tax=Fusarium solani TaxID=169388 RepID=UPI0032C46C9E|nr:hypothetical protein MRS44_017798 [Fusarium solani]
MQATPKSSGTFSESESKALLADLPGNCWWAQQWDSEDIKPTRSWASLYLFERDAKVIGNPDLKIVIALDGWPLPNPAHGVFPQYEYVDVVVCEKASASGDLTNAMSPWCRKITDIVTDWGCLSVDDRDGSDGDTKNYL